MTRIPVALTIAGSDSGGGAGIQADLRTFAAIGVSGTTAITCVTAQNRRAVTLIEACTPRMVRAQLEAVFAECPPGAIKTGMLYTPAIVREVVRFLRQHQNIPLVVDPVMIATSGRELLQPAAAKILQRELLPLATLVTPNLAESEYLTKRKIRTPEDLRAAARHIHQTSGCAVLAKGGHLTGNQALDFLWCEEGEWLFAATRLRRAGLHGTGCAYSAAITAHLALGASLVQAIARAKAHITKTITEHR